MKLATYQLCIQNNMAKTKVKRPSHIHKYKRINLSRNPGVKPYLVFACQQPACGTYIAVGLIEGKLAECWICGDPFIIDKVSKYHSKPHCSGCIKKKVKPHVEALGDLVKDI